MPSHYKPLPPVKRTRLYIYYILNIFNDEIKCLTRRKILFEQNVKLYMRSCYVVLFSTRN